VTASYPPFVYPPARRSDQVDDYHGTLVPDPYRWLEDPDSPESREWIEAQNRLTFGFLETIPERERIHRRLTELWDYEKWGVPFQIGGRYFLFKNDGLQNQAVLYTLDSLAGEPRPLLDPNTLSPDGTVALSGLDISEDSRLLAYGLSSAGSDWQEWKVREVDSGEDRDDLIEWVKFSNASWSHDGEGFYYSRYDEPDESSMLEDANYYQKLYYHRLGTLQAEDVLIYARDDEKEWGFDGTVTDDGKYLIITIWQGTERKNRVFYRELTPNGRGPVVELLNDFDAAYHFVDNDGTTFWFRTDLDAPRARLIAIDIGNPAREHWREIIPQAEETLESVDAVGDRFFASYLRDAQTVIKVFGLDGTFEREVELPDIGTATGFGGRRSDRETFYAFTSFTRPTTIYRYDVASGESTVFRKPEAPFDPEQYETRQVFYTSKDGTRVPMFITHRKGLTLDGTNPTLLYGYGGFNIPQTPAFSVATLVWMELGGVWAVANLRGGGEYGEEWHEAGMKANKQNVFDDFICAAEWLIDSKYTSTPKLAIYGGSNGGLLVGACMTQRPDLFGACVPAVGVMDMLRFHRFTIGWGWVSDYGTPDDAEDFKHIYAYSPLHTIKPDTAYPPTLIVTADHDDRVVPAHSFKFAAALQAAQAGPAPALIRIETRAGHGAGKPTAKVIEEAADRWGFLARVLDISLPPGD
jgi:prolyl oligopeptidase